MSSVSCNPKIIINIQKLDKLLKRPECKVTFYEIKGRHRHKLTDRNDHSERFPTFFNGEDISGQIELRLRAKTLKHKGIRAELHGVIEKYGNIKKTKSFLSLNQNLCRPDEVTQDKVLLEFNFQNVKMPYESYKGDYASVKYFIKVVILSTIKNIDYEKEFAVVNPHNNSVLGKNDEPIRMQVGMKNRLSLSIYFQHKNYSCRGTLKGFIAFNFLNINLKFMEVQIVRREVVFGDKRCEPAYVARYELIDGVPNKNEKIPVRFFLKSYNLTPTYPNIDNVFFVKYYLNLVIADDYDNRYFKQKEICLFRLFKEKKNVYNNNNNNQNNYNYMNEYGEFEDNDEIFITEPIYEEDFYMDNKEIQNYNEEDDNNMNSSFYNDIKGMNAILPSKKNNLQDQKRDEFKQDNYNLLVMYMNNNFQNNGRENSERNNYDDFENMSNNNKKNININIKNKKIININNNNYNNNNNQFNRIKPNNNYNKPNINKVNKAKNEIIINNNTSNYHSIKIDNTKNTYDENNMFEDEEEEMNLTNKKTININNNINNINNNINNINNNINNDNNTNYNEIKTNYRDINKTSNQNYNDDFNKNENINNINNDEDDMNKNQIENKKEVHDSHRRNLMQARISTEDDFNDILNSLDTNTTKKKDELKKNIFG